MVKFCWLNRVGLNSDLIHTVAQFANHREKAVRRHYRKARKNIAHLYKLSDLMCLAVVLLLMEDTYEEYQRLGIADDVFLDTMRDIDIWCANNKNQGLHNAGWIKNHLQLNLFRLGRLQFQMYTVPSMLPYASVLPCKGKAQVVNIHIPQGEKLDKEQCIVSLLEANLFFAKYFPDYTYTYYFCESWLLYDKNREFMEENSNILRFQSLFDIVYSKANDSQAIERIFGKRKLWKQQYAEQTSLQCRAKQYMLSGGNLGFGVGVISKDDVSARMFGQSNLSS